MWSVEYKVRLPDREFVFTISHKLTPSVYAAFDIKKKSSHSEFVIFYAGPMYIAIRSAKYDTSTTYRYGRDFEHVIFL